jgi:type II secretory pathway pseudopilin PulG|tara:strand:- start:330 stop:755 length:426 start_codon:yes stop_codon:yes gene_type:complete
MIELIAVMVIASILATSVITSYSSYNKWQDINEAVLDMVNTLRSARDYCMAANEKFYLTVTIGATDSYTLTYKDAKDALNLPGESSNVFTLPNYFDITASDVGTDLEFNILGEPTATKTITINTNERTINIVSPTGYIYAE